MNEMEVTVRPVTPSGIVATALRELHREARSIENLPPEFQRKLEGAMVLASGIDKYASACTTVETPALSDLARATASEDWSLLFATGATDLPLEQEMLSGHIEGRFLRMLVGAMGARRILEIGLFSGYSALAMAEALPHDGMLVACEIDPFAAEFARRWFSRSPHGSKIRVEVAPANLTLARLAQAGEAFDFVFVDADKGGYAGYLDTLLRTGLLATNALICVDNTLLQGEPFNGGEASDSGRAIADFNRLVAADNRVEQVLLPIRDGITLIRRV